MRDLNGLRPPAPPPSASPVRDRVETALAREPIMEWFSFAHLPAGPMRETSAQFAILAEFVHATLPREAERSTALRKLLEGKDAAVRAARKVRP